MWMLNRVIGGLIDGLLLPFRWLPPAMGLAFISVLAAVGMLLVFRATSDQPRLAATKRRIQGAILEIRLFNEDPRFVLAAQRDVLRHSVAYLRLTLVPLLWMALPLLVLMAHLQTYYGYRGLVVGETAIVKAKLENAASYSATPSLEGGAGVTVETPVLWVPALRELDWRIGATAPGKHELRLTLGDAGLTKAVLVSGSPGRRSAKRPSASLLDQLLYPSEAPLGRGAAVAAIEVGYPAAEVSLLGWETHWIIAFLIITLLAALALRGPLRVTF